MMYKAVETEEFSCYHFEAAIAAEHVRAKTFADTNWDKILKWYEALYNLQAMPIHVLTMAVICMQNSNYEQSKIYFDAIEPKDLEQRAYLYYAGKADYYAGTEDFKEALVYIDKAIKKVSNSHEKFFLLKKRSLWSQQAK